MRKFDCLGTNNEDEDKGFEAVSSISDPLDDPWVFYFGAMVNL